MIDIKKFTDLQKNSQQAFQQQKLLLKKVMAGQRVECQSCHQPLRFILPAEKSADLVYSQVACQQGCTDIQLDVIN